MSEVEGGRGGQAEETDSEASWSEGEDEAWRTLYSWQKFIRIIIDQMRVAYLAEQDRIRCLQDALPPTIPAPGSRTPPLPSSPLT